MLRLLKKKPEAAAPAVSPWHPNFRNFERLPDTKVVRTTFFINGAAVVVAAVLLLLVAYREYELRDLRGQIANWQEQIDHDKASSDQAIQQFKKFQAEAARIGEIEAFLTAKPVVSDLLILLGGTLPQNIALDAFELRPNGLRLVASIRGAPDQASGHASKYLEQLRGNAELGARFDDIALLNIDRNPQTGRLLVEYFLKFKASAAKK